jgi:hypothetical protein
MEMHKRKVPPKGRTLEPRDDLLEPNIGMILWKKYEIKIITAASFGIK